MQWVEADLKGKVLGRWDVSEQEPAAFTRSGALYAHSGDAVLIFDRTKKAWRRVGVAPNGTLLGADGDILVFLIRGTSTLRWVRASE